MGPYSGNSSRTYWKNGLPETAIWSRFPKMGQPGGPGGRLMRDLLRRGLARMRVKMMEMRKVSVVKRMVLENSIDEWMK